MEKEAINRAIKEATGLDLDFASDLNACHEMEKVLKTTGEWIMYTENIAKLCLINSTLFEAYCNHTHSEYAGIIHKFSFLVKATAAQRCEAFLRTLNLWKE